jgi:hypothetical protein
VKPAAPTSPQPAASQPTTAARPDGTNSVEPDSELAPVDDAVIGRALRGSVVVLLVLALAGAGLLLAFQRRTSPAPAGLTPLAAPALAEGGAAEPPRVQFTDITEAAGVRFVHVTGAYGEKLLPETMGSGAAFFDFDGDGDPDLLFVNSTWWPWRPLADASPPTAALYRNDGSGRFEDVTAGSGLDVPLYGMGIAVGDYDNDGRVDVFLTAVGGQRLFHNQGAGRFRDVTAEAGVGGDPADWGTCATWLDVDNDGDLDLFVGHYIRWSRDLDLEIGFTLVGLGRAYGQPTQFEGAFPALYRNDGQGRFTDVSATSGVQVRNPATGVPLPKPLGVAPVDVDRDGWIDLVVANDTVQNLLLLNQRNGTFQEIGAAAGVAFDSYGNTRGAMGIDAAWFRNDDSLGIAIGNFANEMTALYVAQGTPTNFVDEAITEGVGPASRLLLKFGLFFLDYDLDGWLDLLSANGHLENQISRIQQSQSYAQPAQLFWNAGGAGQTGLQLVDAAHAGPDLFQPIVGRGAAYADMDGDGDLDVVLTQSGGRPLLLRNDQPLGHHWVRLKLVGTRSNRDALGAHVTLRAGPLRQARQVTPTHSYLSQSELVLTFGLGHATRVDELVVAWPSGRTELYPPPALDALTVVTEP